MVNTEILMLIQFGIATKLTGFHNKKKMVILCLFKNKTFINFLSRQINNINLFGFNNC